MGRRASFGAVADHKMTTGLPVLKKEKNDGKVGSESALSHALGGTRLE